MDLTVLVGKELVIAGRLVLQFNDVYSFWYAQTHASKMV